VSRIVEAVYEKGVLKPLEEVKLREGERVRIIILAEGGFYDLFERIELEAREDVDRVVDEVRGRAREKRLT
jgi:predicted DNA-binding antitoxin AbrB/MazE fold protein